ncbi:transcriptional regulator [Sporosarcina sp. FSL K6-6792]|uniref:transcriptional regulator n=1 Tax=Sporosarcina sp. FSL K6-6792 TaxID=2921559 RepID=UPI0030F9AABE
MLEVEEGTSVRNRLVKSVEYSEHLDMLYMAADGSISKRRINVLQVGEVSFRAYCFLRKSKRTFTIDNVLALVPVVHKERMVI